MTSADLIARLHAALDEHAGSTLRLHTGDVMVGESHVAAVTDGTAVLRGVERRWSTVVLYRLRDGRVAECWLVPLEPRAFAEIWC